MMSPRDLWVDRIGDGYAVFADRAQGIFHSLIYRTLLMFGFAARGAAKA